ncbi:MAG: hypothetical protein IM674_10075, partial [Brevundimonas sp.]|nr:hypothetical protein [Brevundimonas sp.]
MKPGLTLALLLGLGAVSGCASTPLAQTVASSPPPPMNRTVIERMNPQVEALLVRLMDERRDMVIDGQPVFGTTDKFLPGKIAVALAALIVDTPADDPRRARFLEGFRDLSVLTIDDPNTEWGAYYSLLALNRLNQAGLLDDAVDPQTLARLRTQLDWRT